MWNIDDDIPAAGSSRDIIIHVIIRFFVEDR